jgi:hypothetical protein
MRLCLMTLIAVPWIVYPAVSNANVIYTLSVDYSGINSALPGSTLNWSFEVPSLLTTETDVTTFLSTSIGPGFGSCGVVTDIVIPAPGNGYPYSSSTLWSGLCGVGDAFSGAAQQFLEDPDSLGVFDAYGHNGGAFLGTLTISEATPEPATVFSLALGSAFLLMAGWRLRGRRQRRSVRAGSRSQRSADKVEREIA